MQPFLSPHPAIFEQLPFLSHRQPGARVRILRASNGAPTATAPTAAVDVVDAEQHERDEWFQELVARCRRERVRETTITLALDQCGRTIDQLYDALDREEITEGTSNVAGANLNRVCEKESNMTQTENEKRQTKREWDSAVEAQHVAHPTWTKARCISAVTVENPALHQRLLDAANSR